jgi:hypothetical protein
MWEETLDITLLKPTDILSFTVFRHTTATERMVAEKRVESVGWLCLSVCDILAMSADQGTRKEHAKACVHACSLAFCSCTAVFFRAVVVCSGCMVVLDWVVLLRKF